MSVLFGRGRGSLNSSVDINKLFSSLVWPLYHLETKCKIFFFF